MKTRLIAPILLLLCFIEPISGQVPPTMGYQAVLTDGDGNPIGNGSVTLTFKFYDQEGSDAPLWEETQEVEVVDGIFSVILGSVNPFDLPFNVPYWLGISVEGEDEMMPRIPLSSSPYALGGDFGLNCWDLNENGVGDPDEDQNDDGEFDALDCQGPPGSSGPAGPPGPPGVPGGLVVLDSLKVLLGSLHEGHEQFNDGITVFGHFEFRREVDGQNRVLFDPDANGFGIPARFGDLSAEDYDVEIKENEVVVRPIGRLLGGAIGVGDFEWLLENPPDGFKIDDPGGGFVYLVGGDNADAVLEGVDGESANRAKNSAIQTDVGLAVFYPDPDPVSKIGFQSEIRGTGPAGWFLKSASPTSSATALPNGMSKQVTLETAPLYGSGMPKGAQQGAPALWGLTDLGDVTAVLGQINNAGSNLPAIWGFHTGTGAALNGQIDNTASSAPAVWGITNGPGSGVAATVSGNGTALIADHTGASGNIAEFRSGSVNQARIDKTGKGFFNGGTQTGGADVAEAFEVEGNPMEYEPGDVLVISQYRDRTMTKSTEPYSTRVSGVYATRPGVLLTETGVDDLQDNAIPVGVLGVLPTKVSDENGPIRRGDLLVTSATPGHAMKGTDGDKMFGAVLGKALQEFEGDGTGVIRVLVSLK